jgi:hypothetical protein
MAILRDEPRAWDRQSIDRHMARDLDVLAADCSHRFDEGAKSARAQA